MNPRSMFMSVGARAVRALTAARSRAGEFPGRNQTLSFLGPEPTGRDAHRFHVREKRKLSARLREFFVYSPALGRTVGVRVLLPGRPSEHADVIYLFHGSGDDFRSWTDLGAAEQLTADSPYLVVMPDAGAGSYSRHQVDGRVLDWPQFHTQELPDFVADRFSVSPERSGRLLAGLSMGGYGAMKYAAQHPDRYRAAAAFSSPLDPLRAVPLFDIIALREGGESKSLFGDPRRDRAEWEANSPMSLTPNLAGTQLYFTAGSGTPDPDDTEDEIDVLEAVVNEHGEAFHARLESLGIAHTWLPRPTGLHNWYAWQRELAAWLTWLDDTAAAGPDAVWAGASGVHDGGAFSFVTGEPIFSVHGWDVSISRRRAQLVTFSEVTASTFTLNGAGTFRVRTPALFHPGQSYRIAVSSPLSDNIYDLAADAEGRLELTGRMAGALHDPIVPGKRTRHFRTWGQDEVTTVTITPVAAEESSRFAGASSTAEAGASTTALVRERPAAG
ncbi:alpha/beta hydrolase [Brevibacterium daeguense]|nr:alpha/beta hydrolase family protein [Brevibacterium daeguense]